jgi:citrate lyase synthetase
MQTVTLKINDSFYEHFMALVDSLPKKQVKVIERSMNEEMIVSSATEVRRRAFEAENRIKSGEYVTQDGYRQMMDQFLTKEFGLAQ